MTPRYHPDSVQKTRHSTGITDRNRTGLPAGGDSPCTPDLHEGIEEVNKFRDFLMPTCSPWYGTLCGDLCGTLFFKASDSADCANFLNTIIA